MAQLLHDAKAYTLQIPAPADAKWRVVTIEAGTRDKRSEVAEFERPASLVDAISALGAQVVWERFNKQTDILDKGSIRPKNPTAKKSDKPRKLSPLEQIEAQNAAERAAARNAA